MREIQISRRLKAVAALVSPGLVLADVGCDHGYIGAALLRLNKAEKVVFADISAPSLEKARRLCEKEGLTDRAEFFVCDGTAGIRRADCVVIAGMGGKESIHILEECAFEPSFVVLQPMKNLPDVRKYVAGRYRIISDRIIKDGKFYKTYGVKPQRMLYRALLTKKPLIASQAKNILGAVNKNG